MNETDLILNAMKKKAPPKRKVKKLQFIEQPELFEVTKIDAIGNIYKKTQKKKAKSQKYWEMSDFLAFFEDTLKKSSFSLDRTNISYDTTNLAIVYDELVRRFDDQMSNKIMADYLTWWASEKARKVGNSISVHELKNDKYINEFVQFKNMHSLPDKKSEPEKEIDVNTLYTLGGLPMLLRSKGIVVSARVLREKNDFEWMLRIQQAMQSFTKEHVVDVMKKTISSKYPLSDIVDFISIARPSLEFHKLKEFSTLQYRSYFS